MMREEEDEAEQLFHIMFLHVTFIININKNQLLSPAVVDGDSSVLPENI